MPKTKKTANECKIHLLATSGSEWEILWYKICSEILQSGDALCPLCALEVLAEGQGNVAKKATNLIEAYNKLCDAEADFYGMIIDEEESASNNFSAIGSLELDQTENSNSIKAKVRKTTQKLEKKTKNKTKTKKTQDELDYAEEFLDVVYPEYPDRSIREADLNADDLPF